MNLSRKITLPDLDYLLILSILSIASLGLIMVVSASVGIGEKEFGQAFYYGKRHAIYLGIGLVAGWFSYRMPIRWWQQYSTHALVSAFLLLLLLFIPGIGRTINGSSRWLSLGPVSFQVSEWVKFAVILYLSSYLVRHKESVQTTLSGFLRPMGLLAVFAAVLLKQPDFGATFVILCTALGMLFVGGAPLRQFLGLVAIMGMGFAALAITSPYRLQRLTSFLDPWADQFDSGYQLTQALIAFGRGKWFGVGLGSSVQKLFYLPEAHTDFLFAVLAEEWGLFGCLLVIVLYGVLVYRGLCIGLEAKRKRHEFQSFVAYGISLWIGLQAFINIGVNAGMLPTKGLTLPLMSAGGSSLVILCMALGLLVRVDAENRKTAPFPLP